MSTFKTLQCVPSKRQCYKRHGSVFNVHTGTFVGWQSIPVQASFYLESSGLVVALMEERCGSLTMKRVDEAQEILDVMLDVMCCDEM